MKVQDVIEAVDQLKPNDFTVGQKKDWLLQLEQTILSEVICPRTQAGIIEKEYFTGETQLRVQPPYDNIYALWLEAQIDRQYSEIAKYNNAITVFNAAYQTFVNWYNRTHMPQGETVKYW